MTTARGRDTTTVIYRTTSCCGKVFRITKPTPRSLHHAQSYTFAKQKRKERNKYVIMDRGSVQKSERHAEKERQCRYQINQNSWFRIRNIHRTHNWSLQAKLAFWSGSVILSKYCNRFCLANWDVSPSLSLCFCVICLFVRCSLLSFSFSIHIYQFLLTLSVYQTLFNYLIRI